jgi:hypothetical protein
MAERGAPLGNNNAAKSKVWTAAIMRALEIRSIAIQKPALDELAMKLLDKCEEGDLAALQELANRLEGKPAQGITLSGDEENPLRLKRIIEYVKTNGSGAGKPNGSAQDSTAGET